jgi:exopolysaccharide/PEP-CTERM locus tyrosine autokinase
MSNNEEAMKKLDRLQGEENDKESSVKQLQRLDQSQKQITSARIEITNPLLVTAHNGHSPVAEEYRKLKSRIVQMSKMDNSLHTLLITSSISGEGKSITSLNLAISLAHEHDLPVLLVDADLRRPSICGYLGLESSRGLSDCLMHGMVLEEALIDIGLGNLTILPAGKQVINPVELYSSEKMDYLFDQIKKRYAGGFIVFDSTPVLPFAEAHILANKVDGVVFVVREGGASMPSVKEALDSLKDSRVLGMVFNSATSVSLGGYYHYGYRYGYRSGYSYDYHSHYNTTDPKDQTTDSPPSGKSSKHGFFSRIRKSKSDKSKFSE